MDMRSLSKAAAFLAESVWKPQYARLRDEIEEKYPYF